MNETTNRGPQEHALDAFACTGESPGPSGGNEECATPKSVTPPAIRTPAHWVALARLVRPIKYAKAGAVYVPGGQEHGPFMRYVEPRYRGMVASMACQAVRDGATTTTEVLENLARQCPYDPIAEAGAKAIEDVGKAQAGDYLVDLANWALWWVALPKAERRRIQGARSTAYRQGYFETSTPEQRARQRQKGKKQREVRELLGYEPGAYGRTRELVEHWVRTGEQPWTEVAQ